MPTFKTTDIQLSISSLCTNKAFLSSIYEHTKNQIYGSIIGSELQIK
jgi:hypothetical protein